MALFPRLVASEFVPMFRLLDDYATHMVSRGSVCGPAFVAAKRSFQPRFDIRESKDSYELHGELPGINQKDINIEFIDPQTLSIKGRTETRVQRSPQSSEAAESAIQKEQPEALTDESSSAHYRKPSVEDENATTGDFVNIESPADAKAAETPVAESQQVAPAQQEHKQQSSRYWLSERSIGEFSRTFAFPARVDQEQVKASLKDGILSIVVPKAAAPALRRINIE